MDTNVYIGCRGLRFLHTKHTKHMPFYIMKYMHLFLSTHWFASASAKVYTGFSYGAFWSYEGNVKRYADFYQGFELAKNLTNTPVPFDSARLYTCIMAGTQSDPTEAFQAAIDTGTNLLLGMWASPGAVGQSNDAQIENELAALGKGFQQHGQKLADLVIGLSVGNEDVYRFNNAAVGIGTDNLLIAIKNVRKSIAASSWAKYMSSKLIGHTDTATYAVMPSSDFIGLTGYPYWEGKSIDDANQSFMANLIDTQQRAGNISVWISELGWPVEGKQNGNAVASAENYQRYWDEVGCQLFGKYNTFWFELLHDSQSEQPDWGLLDIKTHRPRIRDLSCSGRGNGSVPTDDDLAASLNEAASQPQPTTFSKIFINGAASPPATFSSPTNLLHTAASSQSIHTTHSTIKQTATVAPASLSSTYDRDIATVYMTTSTYVSPTLTPELASSSHNGTVDDVDNDNKVVVCIVMMDLLGDGTFIPVATQPASGINICELPPRFTGSPFAMIVDSTTPPAPSEQVPPHDLDNPSKIAFLPPTTSPELTVSPPAYNGPACATLDGVIYDVMVVDKRTYLGKPTTSCPSIPSAASTATILPMPTSPSFSLSLAWSMFHPPFQTISTAFTLTTPPSSHITFPAASANPDCVSVNGKYWIAAFDEHGLKHISGTGIECSAKPTSLPNKLP